FDGAGRATTRNTRGLTRSVIARMAPPLPAASRPSNTIMTRNPLCLTHSWRWHNRAWSLLSSFSYFLFFNFFPLLDSSLSLMVWFRVGVLRGNFHDRWHELAHDFAGVT